MGKTDSFTRFYPVLPNRFYPVGKTYCANTDPESHNAQRHRQTDRRQDDANSRSYCVAVRSAKNVSTGAIIRAKPGTDRAGRS